MSKPKNTFRFAVANSLGECSSIWRVWSDKNEIYASFGKFGDKYKASFHSDGNHFLGITDKERSTITDKKWKNISRHKDVWNISLSKRINRLVEIWIPPYSLTKPNKKLKKKTCWIEPARLGNLSSICLFRAPASTHIDSIKISDSEKILHHQTLYDGSNLLLLMREVREPENLRNFINVRYEYITSLDYDEISHGSLRSFDKIQQNERTVVWHADEYGNRLWIDTKYVSMN